MYIIKEYFSTNQINDIKIEVDNLLKLPDKKNSFWKYYEHNDKNVISRIEYFVKYSTTLRKLSENFFRDSNYILIKDKINFKYPNGEGFIAHQDISAGWGKYGDNHITIAIPLQDTNIENGCLYFANIKTDKILTPLFTDLTDDIVSPDLYEPCLTNCGDIIIFDSFIPHKSFINKSNNSRIIIYFTYILSNSKFENVYEKYHEDKFQNNPPDIYKDPNKKYRSGNTFNKR